METVSNILLNNYDFIWGLPFLLLLSLVHIYLTIRTKFIQRKVFTGIKLSFSKDTIKQKDMCLKGELSNYRVFSVVICGTLGTGNILGMATAIYLGGPGAVFWCVIMGFFAMASSYTETYLTLKFRKKSKEGRILAGPMYVIEHGFGLKWLATIFALLAIIASLGIGAVVPLDALLYFSTQNIIFSNLPSYLVTIFIALLGAIFIFGGVKSISNITIFITPIIFVTFFILVIAILIINYNYIIPALKLIVTSAFTSNAALGGALGGSFIVAIKYGISKGIFSNEALTGSTPIIAGTSRIKNNHRQALISESIIFWDTIIFCFLTGIVIVSSLLKNNASSQPIELSTPLEAVLFSFHQFPIFGQILLYILVFFLTYSTILVWSYYGERCAEYIFGPKSINIYRLSFLAFIAITPFINKKIIFELSDILIIFMAFPNILATLFLSNLVVKDSKKYIQEPDLIDPTNMEEVKSKK